MRARSNLVALAAFIGLLVPAISVAVVPPGFSKVAVFATNSVRLSSDVQVTGEVVANEDLPGPTLGNDFELYIDRKTTVNGRIRADRIKIFQQATINGNVLYKTSLDNSGTINGTPSAGLGLPVFGTVPPFETGTAGTTPVSIPPGGIVTLAPGAHGPITAGDLATIRFTGGVYNIASIDVQDDVKFLFEAPSKVRIAGKFRTRRRAIIQPTPTCQIPGGAACNSGSNVFYVAGINGSDGALGSAPEAARIGSDSLVRSNFYAKNGTLRLEVNTIATGAFLGKDVDVDRGTQITLRSFFNDTPVAQDDVASVLEDGSVGIAVLADNGNGPDTDSDGALLPSTVTVTIPATNGGTSVNPTTGVVTYTPSPDFFGNDGFEYQVCDDGFPQECDTALVTIEVLPVNDAPSFVKGADQGVQEDAGPQSVPGWATAISPGPANESSQTVTFNVTNDNPGLFSSQPAVASNGTLTYTPAADAFGTAVVAVEAQDNGGIANGGVDTSAPQSFSINVTSVNDPPVAADDSVTTPEETPITIDVLANDTAGPANELQTLNLQPFGGEAGGEAEVVGNQVKFTPALDFFGTRVFSYTACDSGDGADDPTVLCDSATVTVEVTPVNDAPVANPQDVFTSGAITIILTASDVDGDSLTFSKVSDPTKGTLSTISPIIPSGGGPVVSATVDYTPTSCAGDPLVCPEDSFVFRASDGSLFDDEVVTINPGGDTTDPPDDPTTVIVAQDKTVELASGASLTIVLAAAAPQPPQPEAVGDLTFSLVAPFPTLGTTTTPVDSSVTPVRSATTTYSHTGLDGTDTFGFRACEVAVPTNCDDGVITIQIAAGTPEPAPVAEDFSVGTPPATPKVFSLVASAGSAVTCTDNEDCAEGFVCNTLKGVCEPADDGRTLAPLTRSAAGPVATSPATMQLVGSGDAEPEAAAPSQSAPLQSQAPLQGTDWQFFSWSGGPGVFAGQSFEFTGPVRIDVTDVQRDGDRFEVYDNGVLIGTTSAPTNTGTNLPEQGVPSPSQLECNAGFVNSNIVGKEWSSGTFLVTGSGSHSITIKNIQIPTNPVSFPSGSGCIRRTEQKEAAILSYKVLTVPDSQLGTLLDSTGTLVTAGTVLPDETLTFSPDPGAVSGATGSFTYQVTNTLTGKVSNVATVTLDIAGEVIINLCLTNEAACDDGRNGPSAPETQGMSPSQIDAKIDGPRFVVKVEGSGSVSTSRRRTADGDFPGLACDATCGGDFPAESAVVLYARPVGADSEFVAWEGDCSGTSPVTVTYADRDTLCIAVFRSKE